MKNLALLFILFLFSFPVWSKNQVKVFVDLSPTGSFIVESNKVKGRLKESNGKFVSRRLYVKVRDLSSDMELRDKHMREKLLMEKHSRILVHDVVAKNGEGRGLIEIRGIKKPISFTYTKQGKQLKASFDISLKDFGISGISYMGIGVQDKVKLHAFLDS